MAFESGRNRVQYQCVRCKTVSPHDDTCFCCGCEKKVKVIVPEIVKKKIKGQGITISVR